MTSGWTVSVQGDDQGIEMSLHVRRWWNDWEQPIQLPYSKEYIPLSCILPGTLINASYYRTFQGWMHLIAARLVLLKLPLDLVHCFWRVGRGIATTLETCCM